MCRVDFCFLLLRFGFLLNQLGFSSPFQQLVVKFGRNLNSFLRSVVFEVVECVLEDLFHRFVGDFHNFFVSFRLFAANATKLDAHLLQTSAGGSRKNTRAGDTLLLFHYKSKPANCKFTGAFSGFWLSHKPFHLGSVESVNWRLGKR